MYTDTNSHAHIYQRSSSQTHVDTLRTRSAVFLFKVGMSKPLHQVSLADLLYLSATETTSTTCHSCAHLSLSLSLSHILLRVNSALFGGMTIPHTNRLWVQQWDWYGRKVCSNSGLNTWRWRHKFSHVRHPVAASCECKCFKEQFCVGDVLTSWGRPHK